MGNEKSDAKKIVGVWECKDGTITFTADGYMYAGGEKGSYVLEGDYINTSFTVDDERYNITWKYSFETDDTLIMEYEDDARVYTRVE